MHPVHALSAGTLGAVHEMSGWTGQTPEGIGRGIALTCGFGASVAQVIKIVAGLDGCRIDKAWIATSCKRRWSAA